MKTEQKHTEIHRENSEIALFTIETGLLRVPGAGLDRNLTRKAKRKTPIKVMTLVFGSNGINNDRTWPVLGIIWATHGKK